MTRYFANFTSRAARKKFSQSISTGFETEAEARAHAEFLAGYGGVVAVTTAERVIAKVSAARGWH